MNWSDINISQLPTPCYVINCDILKQNLMLMKKRCDLLGIKPLIAVKGFPLALIFDVMSPYLNGASASSLFEAYLCRHLGKEIHIHAPAYKANEINEVLLHCDHVVFNSISQWEWGKNILNCSSKKVSPGLRINPEYSEIDVDKYDPCMRYFRLGIKEDILLNYDISGIEGFHLHVMYDQNAETFARIIDVVIKKIGKYLPQLTWINFGGGQQIADSDYKIELLKNPIYQLKHEFGIEVYIEPCESIVTNSGYLVSTVLDIVENEKRTAILDTSAICHMPDVLETPYLPDIVFPAMKNTKDYVYTLAGVSCLAGDIIGEYAMDKPLQIGDKIIFSDMGAYTFAKENYFNGINHPDIILYDQNHGFQLVKRYDYNDYEKKYF